jgi:hypothetical protein
MNRSINLVAKQTTIRLTFTQRSKIQQAIYDHLKDEPDSIMSSLIDRYLFLALAKTGSSTEDLVSALIESNTALLRAVDINNAIASQRGIVISGELSKSDVLQPLTMPTAQPTPLKMPLVEAEEDEDGDNDEPLIMDVEF